ncbi:uncharacterized protein LOC113273060 [Papaver somniferum]|uniref:uncharacterized protein LOC113273060 n=1 Tax=Papaver somniferum TaxID=3469 RepID=UPI000E6F6E85|nr:uncharacterized protein LOC113273060 [Papaver somniferum]
MESVWKDKWVKDYAIIERHEDDIYILQNTNLKVSDLIQNGEWNIPAAMVNFFDTNEQPVLRHGKDKRIWTQDITSSFTVANAAQMIRKKHSKVTWEKQVWQPCIHPYTSCNVWKILRGDCATEETVRKKGFHTVSKCYLCGNNQDTMEHLLWSCDFSERIWHWMSEIFKCSKPVDFEEIMKGAKGHSPAIKEVRYICSFNIMVELWFLRNAVIYDAFVPNNEYFQQKIMRITKESSIRMIGKMWGRVDDLQILHFFGISGIKATCATVKQVFFKLPEVHQVLICCDGALKSNPGLAGFGFVARVNSGECVGAASGGIGLATNYLAEVMALIVAGEWAISKFFQQVYFILDSKAVIVAFSNNKVPWIVQSRWERIRRLIPYITFKHSYRETNFSADNMAKKGVLLSRELSYIMKKNQAS